MSKRTQIEVSKDNLRRLHNLKSEFGLRVSLTVLANKVMALGLPPIEKDKRQLLAQVK